MKIKLLKILVAISILDITPTSIAETLSFPFFRIDVEDGWVQSLEIEPETHSGTREWIKIHHPDRKGALKLQTINVGGFIRKERLRLLTNVDSSTPLTWQDWGDYSGYQYDYSEGNSFYRQWWLANETEIMFIVYETDAISNDFEIEEIDNMVDSLAAIKP